MMRADGGIFLELPAVHLADSPSQRPQVFQIALFQAAEKSVRIGEFLLKGDKARVIEPRIHRAPPLGRGTGF